METTVPASQCSKCRTPSATLVKDEFGSAGMVCQTCMDKLDNARCNANHFG